MGSRSSPVGRFLVPLGACQSSPSLRCVFTLRIQLSSRLLPFRVPSPPCLARRFPKDSVELYLPRFRPSSRLPVRSSTSCRRIPNSVTPTTVTTRWIPVNAACSLAPSECCHPPIAEAQTLLTLHPNVLPPSDADEYRYLPSPLRVATTRIWVSIATCRLR